MYEVFHPMGLLPFPRPEDELSLCYRNLQFGFDGSLIADRDHVYVLSRHPGCRGVRRVYYFDWGIDGVAICFILGFREPVWATEVINISKGYTVDRIIDLQRRWRRYSLNLAHPREPPTKRRRTGR